MNNGDSTNQSAARQARPSNGPQEKAIKAISGASLDPLDLSALCGQFDVYQPGGHYGRLALLGLPLSCALFGAALAWPYAWINYSGYIVSGAKLLASVLIWGFLSGCLAMKAVKLFKVRNPRMALVLSALGFLMAWAVSWPMVHNLSGSSLSLAKFFIGRLDGGVVVKIDHFFNEVSGFEPDYRLFQRYYLVFFWVLEAGLYSLLAGKIASMQARRPFSEISGRWYTKVSLGFYKLEPGDLNILLDLPNCEKPIFLTSLDKFVKKLLPSIIVGKGVKMTLFQDPDWQRPFLSLRISLGRFSSLKVSYYRVTLEEADILIEKFS